MPTSESPIFNKKATEKLRSPDDLDKYLRVTNPGVWITLAACIALLAGLLAWGAFGAVSTSVSATGVVLKETATSATANTNDGEQAVCFLSADDVATVHVGDTANFGGVQMKVASIAKVPSSPDEWANFLESAYLAKTLFNDTWAYPITFEGDISRLETNTPVKVVITTERVTPLSLILKNES